MTREELREEIYEQISSGGGAGLIANCIMGIFDRYEREQWRPVTKPPDDEREVLLRDERGEWYLARYQRSAWVSVDDYRILIDNKKAFWRALPPGPGEGE